MKNSTLQQHCPKKSMFPHNKLTPAEMNVKVCINVTDMPLYSSLSRYRQASLGENILKKYTKNWL